MAPRDGATMPTTLVAKSPDTKIQKSISGYDSPSSHAKIANGYNSPSDNGKNIPESVPDTPSGAWQTQPTQIVANGANMGSSPPRSPNGFVQVPVSSPIRGSDTTPKPATNGTRLMQPQTTMPSRPNLAMSMAPAGTSFKNPAPIIDISDDDDDLQFQEISSDEENTRNTADIKPTKFISGSANSSFGHQVSPLRDVHEVNGISKFQSILASSAYQPRPSKHKLDSESESTSKKSRQMGPSRAEPVPDILTADLDEQTRSKIRQILHILPDNSEAKVYKALRKSKFSLDEAVGFLATGDTSDDEVDNSQSVQREAQFKRGPQAPVASISARYSALKAPTNPPLPPAPKKKRTLVRGRKHKDLSSPAAPTVASPVKPAVAEDYEFRHPDSGIDSEGVDSEGGDSDEDEGEEFDEDNSEVEIRVWKYLQTCTLEELLDFTHYTRPEAQKMIDGRPFRSINMAKEVGRKDNVNKSGSKGKRATTGEKVFNRCVDMFRSFDSLEDLEKGCEEKSKPALEEMKGWGINIFGIKKNGEIEITSLEDSDPSQIDSGLGTPTSGPTSNNGDDDLTAPVTRRKKKLLGQPESMSKSFTLKDYQIVGLNWLALMYEKGCSAILADDMGLGKTYQVIAFLVHLVDTGKPGPHVVVCPGSTLENWMQEINRFAPNLSAVPYHGNQSEREELRDTINSNIKLPETDEDRVNVIVTSYEMTKPKNDNRFFRKLGADAIVYDEGHMLRNATSDRYKAAMDIQAKFRLLLTGTPLQNNLTELISLLGFILPEEFAGKQEELKLIFEAKATTSDKDHSKLLSTQRIERAKRILAPFVLRRKKEQVLKHLPTKTNRIIKTPTHTSQMELHRFYKKESINLEAGTEPENDDAQVDDAEAGKSKTRGRKSKTTGRQSRGPAANSKTKENQQIGKVVKAADLEEEAGNPVMQMRKAAIHPLLFRKWFTNQKIDDMAAILRKKEKQNFPTEQDLKHLLKEMVNASDFVLHTWCNLYPCIKDFDLPGKPWMDSGKVDVLVKLLNQYKENGDRVLVFSQFTTVLDILEAVLRDIKIFYTRIDGSTKIQERQTLIDDFNQEDSDITVFLLTTKAGGTGINLASANKVIIFDSSFNPQDDKQAENRAHRLGQKREVEVITLISEGTIEENMLALGETKLELGGRVAGGDDEPATATES